MLTPAGAPAAGPAPPLAPAPPPGTPCGRGRGAAIARGESEEREERGGECNFTPAQLGAPACPPPASAEAGFWVSEGGREEKRKAGGEERREAAGGGLGCVYIELWGVWGGARRRGGWFRLFGPVHRPGLIADTRTSRPSRVPNRAGDGASVTVTSI
jgi:hypothetical protein